MMKLPIISLLFLLFFDHSFAQLTPPGLGSNSKMNGWFAIGLDQKLDSVGKFSSITYFGLAGESTVDNTNVFEHLGIFVINEEVKFKFKPTWSVSLAASYRHQNEFNKIPPYLATEDRFKHEFRIYSRITKTWKKKWIPSIAFRQEYRKFYNPQFRAWKVSSAFRSRLKFQSEFDLIPSKRLTALIGCEFLFSTEFQEDTQSWRHFEYGETRFSALVSYHSKNKKITYSLGYMNDLLHVSAGEKSVHYISTSIIFKNLF
ncbi:DUF2490 domain-containing protein [Fluviicola taffensis]|uniref:DUF2490 domain-containing protein n=1 Tax=Fluviicola taffensis (strain DSM 16823 / NCIMB 13979 / RW262) TaxID=755732 RepID=F2ICL9_FLUTR|nr:DUF2490 domain-containing protein [Fluviicola taffensis]AEA42246.1 hypothetical protein Fluta_0237 [Fluviicola taffensis DSM 16823]